MVRVLFTVGLAGLHLARVLSTLAWLPYIEPGSFLILARVLFTFGLAGLHLARALSTSGLVALHLVWVFFNVG